ncbi:MAG: hypothetical protein K2M19_09280 [Muribaculaceae bacterium]|nr:hypothetical protein [Muribaculaceae bacterium]
MKKLLLAALAAFTAAGAWAHTLQTHLRPVVNDDRFERTTVEVGPGAAMKAPASRAESTLAFTLAGEPEGALQFNNVATTAYKYIGFEFNAENATAFAGNKLTSVSICTGTNNRTKRNAITSATVYLTYDIQEEPFYTQDVTLGTSAYTFYDCPLDVPYTIEAGKAFFVMCKFQSKSTYDYYLVYDGLYHDTDEGGWCGYDSGKKVAWMNISESYGFIPMKATITGDNLPVDVASIWGMANPSYVKPGEKFQAQVGLAGASANAINSVEITTTVGYKDNAKSFKQNIDLKSGLNFAQRDVVTINDLSCDAIGLDVPVTIAITKVNGHECAKPVSASAIVICFEPEKGYTRNVLIEEATGCWCGWCPRGIVLLEAIREAYNDGTVAIAAVHNGDEMEITSCQAFLAAYVSSFPDIWINRAEQIDFTMTAFKGIYDYFRATPAAATLTATTVVADDDNSVKVSGNVRFAIDAETPANRFTLSFYLTEDGMGPYTQENYYAGGKNGKLDPFDKLPAKTPVTYNDVARDLIDFPGIANSLPTSIKGGKDIAYSFDLPLRNVTSDKFNVIALVTDNVTGEVLNTVVTKAAKNNSVNSAIADADAAEVTATDGVITVAGADGAVAIYTTDGRCVANAEGDTSVALAPGLYIVRAGSTTVKVRL